MDFGSQRAWGPMNAGGSGRSIKEKGPPGQPSFWGEYKGRIYPEAYVELLRGGQNFGITKRP